MSLVQSAPVGSLKNSLLKSQLHKYLGESNNSKKLGDNRRPIVAILTLWKVEDTNKPTSME